MPWLRHLVSTSIIIILMYLIQTEACVTGWFGTECQYRCHCMTFKCGAFGECEDSKCEIGYFGPGCQYVDLGYEWNKDLSQAYLHNPANFCQRTASGVSLTIKLSRRFTLFWMRIQTNNTISAKINDSTVTFDGNPNLCRKQRRYVVSPTVVDVVCETRDTVQNITVQGGIVAAICSVYISGGRNVALKQETSQSSTYNGMSSTLAVDGNFDINTRTCSKTYQFLPVEWWSVQFTFPQYVRRVIIIPDTSISNQEFTVTTLSGNMTTNEVVKTSSAKGAFEYDLTNALLTASIRIFNTKQMLSLSLCEVVVLAETECPDSKYGISCYEKCECRSDELCNVVTGACAAGCHGPHNYKCLVNCNRDCLNNNCVPGGQNCMYCLDGYKGTNCLESCSNSTYGKNCSKKCSNHCTDRLCYPTSGHCYSCIVGYMGPFCEPCPPQSYGNSCKFECLSSCDEGLCNNINGDCIGCQPGFMGSRCEVCPSQKFGPECTENCSDNCQNQTCNNQNGNCIKCAKVRLPPKCTDCVSTNWGEDCMFNCPSSCDKSVCDSVTGNCISCIVGYVGPRCTACPNGTYGQDCAFSCLNACVNKSCNSITGKCLACKDGYFGPQCQACPLKKYGPQCSKTCPTACKRNECDHISGNCFSCTVGSSGPKCATALTPQGISNFKTFVVLAAFSSVIPMCVFTHKRIKKKVLSSQESITSLTTVSYGN